MGTRAADRDGEHADKGAMALTEEELLRQPWKYFGYREFSKFLATDDHFFALRRFDQLHCRVLLSLQDQVTQLEEELDRIDARFSARNAPATDNGKLRGDNTERAAILKNIQSALLDYDHFKRQYFLAKQERDAPSWHVQNMKRWLQNRNNPIKPEEVAFLDREDLIYLSGGTKPPVRRWLETTVFTCFWRIIPRRSASLSDTTRVMSEKTLDAWATAGTFFIFIAMLITPMWLLAATTDDVAKLGIITAFELLLVLILNSCISTTAFEALAIAAGYSVVMVVFLQTDRSKTA